MYFAKREVREDFGLVFCKSRRSDRRCKTPSPAPDTFLHKNDQTRGIDIEDGDSCRDVKIVTSRALRSPHLRLATNPPNTYIVPLLSSPWLRDVKFVFHQLGESQIVAIPLKTKAKIAIATVQLRRLGLVVVFSCSCRVAIFPFLLGFISRGVAKSHQIMWPHPP